MSKKAKLPQITTWYVDPRGHEFTNKLIAENIEDPEKEECHGVMCNDGKERDLWRCSHSLITRLIALRKTVILVFHVYRKIGPNGKVSRWTFEDKHSSLSSYSIPGSAPARQLTYGQATVASK